jgi:hypothetical protein
MPSGRPDGTSFVHRTTLLLGSNPAFSYREMPMSEASSHAAPSAPTSSSAALKSFRATPRPRNDASTTTLPHHPNVFSTFFSSYRTHVETPISAPVSSNTPVANTSSSRRSVSHSSLLASKRTVSSNASSWSTSASLAVSRRSRLSHPRSEMQKGSSKLSSGLSPLDQDTEHRASSGSVTSGSVPREARARRSERCAEEIFSRPIRRAPRGAPRASRRRARGVASTRTEDAEVDATAIAP